MQEINGDLIKIESDIIVQQCNCLTVRGHGLSKYISDNLHIDLYNKRQSVSKRANLAIENDRDTPGICRLIWNEKKVVACLLAQFSPGKPGIYYTDICKELGYTDSYNQREIWFKESLDNLLNQMKSLKVKSVAFPKYIGCGLAGGNWDIYYKLIKEFQEKSGLVVYIVDNS